MSLLVPKYLCEEYEQLELDVLNLEEGEMSTVRFCEKWQCPELRMDLYTTVILNQQKINTEKLYEYLRKI